MENKKLEKIGEWVGIGIGAVVLISLIVLLAKFVTWVWSL